MRLRLHRVSVEQILDEVFRADSGQGPAVTTCLGRLALGDFLRCFKQGPRSGASLKLDGPVPIQPTTRAAYLKSVVLLPSMQ